MSKNTRPVQEKAESQDTPPNESRAMLSLGALLGSALKKKHESGGGAVRVRLSRHPAYETTR